MGTLRKDEAFAKCGQIRENNSFCEMHTLLSLTNPDSRSRDIIVCQEAGRADLHLCDCNFLL